MEANSIRRVTPADQDRVVSLIVLAFSADPAARWLYPDPHGYLTHFPSFVRAFAGAAFPRRSACCAGDYSGAALWLPPGVHPDEEALALLVNETITEGRRSEVFELFARMGDSHPAEAHWYLPIIAVDPAWQSRGRGSALMKRTLTRCDRNRELAYLEASSPRSVPFYQRLGFDLLEPIQVGSSPPIFPMLRRPAIAQPGRPTFDPSGADATRTALLFGRVGPGAVDLPP